MRARILSLNVGLPAKMEWNGRSIMSSMLKTPIDGPLVVHETSVDGDRFASPQLHGTIDSVLYAFGVKSAEEYLRLLGRSGYVPGTLGENLTLDEFDEEDISVGDEFEVGEVRIQATYPRIPCGKVDIRMQHPQGQKLLQACGRSGVYFRILKPGLIHKTDEVVRVKRAEVDYKIAKIYRQVVRKEHISDDDLDRMNDNGAFPQER